MDVRDLAPALLAVGQLFDAANKELNGDKVTVNVSVTATSEGCFKVNLEVAQRLLDQAINVLSGDFVTAALNLKELLIGGSIVAVGLIVFVKQTRGKALGKVKDIGGGKCLVAIDGQSFEISADVLRLYQIPAIRQALERFVADPLAKEGIDKFTASDSEHECTVSKYEGPYFRSDTMPAELLVDNTSEVLFSIVSLRFSEGNRWRLNDGNFSLTAIIADDEFLEKIERNEISFSKGDLLRCRTRTQQYRATSGLSTIYTVEKVVEHIQSQQLGPLELVEIDDDNS